VADGVTCGFALRNLVALPPFFAELARILRPGGRIALLEVATPPNRLLRWGHGIYFGRVVPLIGRLVSDGAAYRYLPRSVAYLPEPEAMFQLVKAAGFTAVERRLLTGGVAQLLTATRTSVAA
jgi:demethylmenaquinone methyltransferase/2-methoxy-6-polyprenyl-1,4-benzoquinol methylase